MDRALMVAIAGVPAAASAQKDGTLTISGLFSMDYLSGERDLDLFLRGNVRRKSAEVKTTSELERGDDRQAWASRKLVGIPFDF